MSLHTVSTVSPTAMKKLLPRTGQHGLDPRRRGHRRTILTCLDALPIPCAEPRSLRRPLLRNACRDSQSRNISSKTCAEAKVHLLFPGYTAERCGNQKITHEALHRAVRLVGTLEVIPRRNEYRQFQPYRSKISTILFAGHLRPLARNRISATNYAMIARVARSCRSQARRRKTE